MGTDCEYVLLVSYISSKGAVSGWDQQALVTQGGHHAHAEVLLRMRTNCECTLLVNQMGSKEAVSDWDQKALVTNRQGLLLA